MKNWLLVEFGLVEWVVLRVLWLCGRCENFVGRFGRFDLFVFVWCRLKLFFMLLCLILLVWVIKLLIMWWNVILLYFFVCVSFFIWVVCCGVMFGSSLIIIVLFFSFMMMVFLGFLILVMWFFFVYMLCNDISLLCFFVKGFVLMVVNIYSVNYFKMEIKMVWKIFDDMDLNGKCVLVCVDINVFVEDG